MRAPLTDLIRLDGKAALVTGGAKGIGEAISYRLAEAGAAVLVVDLDGGAAEAVSAHLSGRGWSAQPCVADVSQELEVREAVDQCRSLMGSVDILVNNAGIYPSQSLDAMTVEDFDRVLDVNLKGLYLCTRYAAEAMREQGAGGSIINVTSIDALHPSMIGLAHYDASKHGAWGFTKSSALELAQHGIRVNAIAPGGVMTPGVQALQQQGEGRAGSVDAAAAFLEGIPMHRMGTPDEIGAVALFLASDMATYVTGSQLVVDGGALLT